MSSSDNASELPPIQDDVERHTLKAEEELRLEVSFSKSTNFAITLRQGSAELYGVELALNKPYVFSTGGIKLAIFTWHGCVVDVQNSSRDLVEIIYTSNETNSNVAAVNAHAQLEALRDQAFAAASDAADASSADNSSAYGPRVLIVGPAESGKTSLAKTLTAYAVKLGRTPIFADLDPNDNCLSVPGTLSACVMDSDSVLVEHFATTGLPVSQPPPVVLWHGGSNQIQPDLFRAQVSALGQRIDERMKHDNSTKTSGIVVNTNGWIQDEGFQLLVHTVKTLRISVVLVMGHDRLYSMMKSNVCASSDGGDKKNNSNNNNKSAGDSIKVIKVPRSGGVVSRDSNYMAQVRSRSIRRYFYGAMVEPKQQPPAGGGTAAAQHHHHRVPQLTPFAIQLDIQKLTLYKFASMSLSASLLPVAAAQTTEHVQIQKVNVTEKLQHNLLAVCHPQAVARYEASGQAKDLYESGVAGFCVVEKILMDADRIHLLSPCAGNLPSHTLLVGDITWME